MTSIKFGVYLSEEEETYIKKKDASENKIFIMASEIDPRYPEMYDATTGDQLVIVLVDIELTSIVSEQTGSANKYIHGIIKESRGVIAEKVVNSANNQVDKIIQQHIFLQLEKGNIATTDPKITHGSTTASDTARKISMIETLFIH